MGSHERRTSRPVHAATLLAAVLACLSAPVAEAQAPLRKIGEMELQLAGLQAVLDPPNPVVPKNTPAGVRVAVRAGGRELGTEEVKHFLGGEFFLEGELRGPGLPQTITLPSLREGEELPADPFILPLPGLPVAGDYELSNVRFVSGGRSVLGVAPQAATLQVIDQILVTKLVTRALTLDELRARGIEITDRDYTGFQFTLGLRLESEVFNIDFPVVFDRDGVVVPQPVENAPNDPTRQVERPATPRAPATIVPMMLLPEGEGSAGPQPPLTMPNGEPVRIPSVLVIPGNVGYLKQFFSAQVYVANGAPVGSRLVLRDVQGTIHLPPGKDSAPGTLDDPLYLAKRIGEEKPPATRPVLGLGPDEAPGTEDDVAVFTPGEQGQAEWVLVGNGEGFHALDIALGATLEGLPTGPVKVKGAASGGVLVRNARFDVTFTVPSVVREGETFRAGITLNNIGQGAGNDVRIALDASKISGLTLLSPQEQGVLLIPPGEAHTFEYEFRSLRTGKVVATYLRFDVASGPGDPGDPVTGRVDFTIGVTDEGVPLSPDTLVLPAAVDLLPRPVVFAAMRVLGQAWSIANAPRGTRPARVTPIARSGVERKAVALAEAGLRITLRDVAERDAARDASLGDLLLDFWGGDPLDAGFDRLLRESEAGRAFAAALGESLVAAADAAGGPAALERSLAGVAASGADFLSLAVAGPVDVSLTDALGRRTVFGRGPGGSRVAEIPGGALLPLGEPDTAPLVGVVTVADATGYRLDVFGPAAIALTAPRGGAFVRGTVLADGRATLAIDVARPGAWLLQQDLDGDGTFESTRDVPLETIEPPGPSLLTAAVIGPETLPRASPFGTNVVLVFDRPVDAETASDTAAYEIPSNGVAHAKPQLSGRLVFATLDRPEGPYVPTSITAAGIADRRGVSTTDTAPLRALLEDAGAVVSGRVREADGTPVDAGAVVYSNLTDGACAVGASPQALARLPLGSDGLYELRYVRQGCPFTVAAADPENRLLRSLEGRVRRAGERIALDIVLLGAGGVEGTVRNLQGEVVPAARVAVVSGTDPGRGASASTDAAGRYRVEGLPVGLVSVKAAKGAGLGSATGRIERGGTTATVDVVLDDGTVRIAGRVFQQQGNDRVPVAGALVTCTVARSAAGYVFTDESGAYALEGMPVGDFTISAEGQGPLGSARVSRSGTAAAGQRVEGFDLVQLVNPETVLGEVRGRVVFPDGDPAPGVIVAQDVSTAFIFNAAGTDATGAFTLAGLPVGQGVSIGAITQDRRRQGQARFEIPADTGVLEGVLITLSGVGSARFTVLSPSGAPAGNQEVALLGLGGLFGVCRNPCGCRSATTDASGTVTFDGLNLGAVTAQAVRREAGFVEAATGTAVITRDGETGFGVIQLLGAGTVNGTVLSPPGVVVTGGEVALRSRAFVNDGQFTCGMVLQDSHRGPVRPDTSTYEFKGVAVGPVTVTARHFVSTAVSRGGNLAKAGETLTLDLQLVDTIAGELSGLVTLPSGTPAGAGVEVTAEGPLPEVTVRTEADGRFAFAKVLPQGSYTLTARDPVTGGVVRDRVYLKAGQDLQHDLRLKGRGTVRVSVVDSDGLPVDRAFVTLREGDYPERRHDRALEPQRLGVATFEGVFEGPFSVEVRDVNGRGGRGAGAVPAPDASVDLTVRMSPTGTVRGRFLMPAPGSAPIPYALVTLLVNGRRVGQATTPGTGELLGAWSFDFVPAGPVRVEAQDPLTLRTGFAVGTLEAKGEDGAGGELLLDVVAQGLGRVSGVVRARSESGDVLSQPGARVVIAASLYEGSTLADGAGTYLFEGVPEGPVTVTASLGERGLAASASGAILGDGQSLTLDVLLRDAGRVTGRVLASDGVAGAPWSRVTITTGGFGGGTLQAYTDADGTFRFDRVATGRAQLGAEVLGGIDRGKGAVDVALGDNEATVRLNGTGPLTVVARDSAGNPIAGDAWIDGTGAFPWQEFVRVPASGLYRLGSVLAGPVTVKLRAKPGEVTLYGTAQGEVRPGEENEAVVLLAPSGTVTGRVLRADGLTPAYGTDVVLQLDGGRGQVKVQAGASGGFTASGVPTGGFDLRASDPVSGGLALARSLSLDANGQVLDLGDLVLDDRAPILAFVEPSDGAVRPGVRGPLVLELADENGIDPASLSVHYSSGGVEYASAFAIAGGRATGTLEPGWTAVGANTLRAYVKDQAGRVGEAEVTFRVIGATLRGTVRLATGAPAAGVAVRVDGKVDVVTDEQGAFVVTGLREGSHSAQVVDPVTGQGVYKSATVPDGGEAAIELQLPAYAWLVGTVTRRSGALAAGVVVTTSLGRQSVTGADGRFSLGALPLGAYTVEAGDPGNGDRGRVQAVLSENGATVDLPVPLNGVGTVTVAVETALGSPVALADVTVRSASPLGGTYQGRTGAAGEPVLVAGVLAGTLTVEATSNGLRGVTTLVLLDGEAKAATVALEPAGRVAGVVTQALGGPAAGATVRLTQPRYLVATTPAAGSFAFDNVPVGAFTVEAETARGDRGRATGQLSRPGQAADASITLNGLGTVAVRVANGSGAPVDGADVTVTSRSPFGGTWKKKTAAGLARFEDVLAGDLDVTARDPVGGAVSSATGRVEPGAEVEIPVTLKATGTVRGRVVSAAEPGGVSGIEVSVGNRKQVTGAGGAFSIADLPLGTYTVEARRSGRLRARQTGVVVDAGGQEVEVELVLVVTGRVQGVVTKGTSNVAGARIDFYSDTKDFGGYFFATSGPNGEYGIDDVPAGPFHLSATSGLDRREASGTMPAAGGTVTVDLVLQPSAVYVPTTLGDAGGSSFYVGKDGSLGRSPMLAAADRTPRLTLVREGVTHAFAGSCPTSGSCSVGSEEGGRELVFTQANLGGLDVTRKVFIPADGYFVRTLDLIENSTSDAVPIDVLEDVVLTGLVGGQPPLVTASSSGDDAADAADLWVAFDDPDADDIWSETNPSSAFAPTVLVSGGEGALVPAELSATPDWSRTTATRRWNAVVVPPQGKVAILHFLAVQSDRARAVATGERLAALPPEALAGLAADEAAAVVNFQVPADLVSALEPLPPNDGVVEAVSLAGDRETVFQPFQATVRSRSPYYGRLLQMSYVSAEGLSRFTARPANGEVVPRGPFDVTVTSRLSYTDFGRMSRVQAGDFLTPGEGSVRLDVVFEGTGVLEGQVLRSDRSALNGAVVTLSDPTGQALVYTYGGNSFRFAPVPAGTYQLAVTHPYSYDDRIVSPGLVLPGPCTAAPAGPRCEKVTRDLVFEPFGGVIGLVTTAGDLLASADLGLSNAEYYQTTKSNATTGEYRFSDVPPGSYTLWARDPRSQAVVSRSVLVEAGSDAREDLVLLPVGTVVVTATSGGQVLSAATVYWQSAERGGTWQTGPNTNTSGRATLTNVVGDPVQIRVRHPSNLSVYGYGETRIVEEARTENVAVDLPALGNVSGVLRSRDGLAWTSGIQMTTAGADDVSYAGAQTQAGGAFALANVPRGSVRIRSSQSVTSPASFSFRGEVEVPLTGPTLAADGLYPAGALAPGAFHLWHIEAPEGAALSVVAQAWAHGADPVLQGRVVELWAPDGRRVASAPASASYEIPTATVASATAGPWVAAVRSTSTARGGYRIGFAGTGNLFARTWDGGFVETTVRRGETTVAGITVTLETSRPDVAQGERVRTGTTGTPGTLLVPMRAGTVTARAVDPTTGATREASGLVTPDGTLALTITLTPTASTILGTVTNGDGLTPLPGAVVTLSGVGSQVADAAAAYRFDAVPPGTYTLSAEFRGVRYEATFPAGGGEVVRELRVPIPVVRGRFLEPDGTPVVPALVEVCGGWSCVPAEADESGGFRYFGREASWGSSSVYLQAKALDGSNLSAFRYISYPPGFTGTVAQDLVLPASATLSGVITTSAGAAVEGARVYAYGESYGSSPLLREGIADANGEYRFRHVSWFGGVRVHAEDEAGHFGAARGQATPGQQTRVDVQFVPTGELEISILDAQGQSLPGVLTVQSIEHLAPAGGPWTRVVDVPGPDPVVLEAPVGLFRVVLAGDPTAAAEGSLSTAGRVPVRLTPGTHVRLPFPLEGDEATFVGEYACAPPCSGFARTRVTGIEDYLPVAVPEHDGRGLRGLLVAGSGVRVRRVQYAPPSGAFGRTLTLVTNPGTEPVTVDVGTRMDVLGEIVTLLTPDGDGTWEPGEAWAAVTSNHGAQALVIGNALAPRWSAVNSYGEAGGSPSAAAAHDLTLAPGETRAFLTFTLTRADGDAESLSGRAQRLADLTEPGALAGLTNAERAAIVNFAVPPAGDVEATVESDGPPIAGAVVGLLDGSGGVVARGATDAAGRALLAGVPPGTYTAVAVGSDGRPGHVTVVVAASATAPAGITLLADEALGSVALSAAFAGTGAPVADLPLALEADGWSPIWRPRAATDASGAALVGRVPPGPVRVAPEGSAAVVVAVAAGAAAPATLAIEPFGVVTGVVTAGDGATPFPGAIVEALDEDSDAVLAAARADASGAFRLGALRPGTSGLRLRARSPYDAAVEVSGEAVVAFAAPGEAVEQDLVLPVGVVRGGVFGDGGPVRFPSVLATYQGATGPVTVPALGGAAGEFVIVGVPPGEVRLDAVDPASGVTGGTSLQVPEDFTPVDVSISVFPPVAS